MLLLPLGAPLPGYSMPFAVTQKCFLASTSKRWEPGTHVAKPELLGALGSCRRLQQPYFPSLLLPHALMDTLWGRSSDPRAAWQGVRAQQAEELQRNGTSMEKGGRERSDPCGGLQDFARHMLVRN